MSTVAWTWAAVVTPVRLLQKPSPRFERLSGRNTGVILVDAGPLVALFDPTDSSHARCVEALESIREPIGTSLPVLTEAFHLLQQTSVGALRLMDFVMDHGLQMLALDEQAMARMFELMIQYADVQMDFADASLITLAEINGLSTIFTIDRNDFTIYRVRRGHEYIALNMIP